MNSARNKKQSLTVTEPGTSSPPGHPSIRSQDRSVRPTLRLLAYVSERDTIDKLSEFHMTVRLKTTTLTPKEASMLLQICNCRAVYSGVDFTLYLAMEYLQGFMRKTGTDIMYVKNEKMRTTLLLSELILTAVKGLWFTLGDKEMLPLEVKQKIEATGWLPAARTLHSWQQHWDLEKYLQVRIVPVEHLLERQTSAAERYSAYTRGYGQDGNLPAPHRTKDDPVDGDLNPDPPSFNLLEFEQYVDILNSIEINKAQKKQR
jgi:hypothetical protein